MPLFFLGGVGRGAPRAAAAWPVYNGCRGGEEPGHFGLSVNCTTMAVEKQGTSGCLLVGLQWWPSMRHFLSLMVEHFGLQLGSLLLWLEAWCFRLLLSGAARAAGRGLVLQKGLLLVGVTMHGALVCPWQRVGHFREPLGGATMNVGGRVLQVGVR